jgi:hypothetical protein
VSADTLAGDYIYSMRAVGSTDQRPAHFSDDTANVECEEWQTNDTAIRCNPGDRQRLERN